MRAQALAPWLGCAGSGLGWWIGGGARGTPPGSGVAAGSRPRGAGDGVVEDLRAAEHLLFGLAAGVSWLHPVGRDQFRCAVLHDRHGAVAVRDRVPAVVGRAFHRLGRAVSCGVSRLGTAAAGQVGPALGLQVPVTVAPRAPLGLGDHRADLVGEVPGCDTVWGGRTVKGED